LSETRKEETALLVKAERSLAVANELLHSGHADFAASRLYYGCFYIAEALLLHEDLRFSRHGQVLAQYGRIFAKPERLDRHFHRLLERTFSLRQVADYSAEAEINPTEISDLVSQGSEFLHAARAYLGIESRTSESSEGDTEKDEQENRG
jgi:uncharacterized protein (UPF0332 family)